MTPDPYDQFWEWALKPLDSPLTIPVEIHEAVMALTSEDRRDREKVNRAVRDKQERQVNEMIERVAKALWHDAFPDTKWSDIEQMSYMGHARAAIAAMREPTQQMRLAGIAKWSRPDPTPEHESTLVFNAIWQAMIDAALAETGPPLRGARMSMG